jgi:hypothetical protein
MTYIVYSIYSNNSSHTPIIHACTSDLQKADCTYQLVVKRVQKNAVTSYDTFVTMLKYPSEYVSVEGDPLIMIDTQKTSVETIKSFHKAYTRV